MTDSISVPDSTTKFTQETFGKFPCLLVASRQPWRLGKNGRPGVFMSGDVNGILPVTAEGVVQEAQASTSDGLWLDPDHTAIWFCSNCKASASLLRKYQVSFYRPHKHTVSLMTGLRRKDVDGCQHTLHLKHQPSL